MTSVRRPEIRRALIWALVWIVVALVFVNQNILSDLVADRGIRWFSSVLQEVLYWLPFAAATPLFAYMASRFPIEGDSRQFSRRRMLAMHAVAALCFAALQPWIAALLTNGAAELLLGPADPRTAQIAASRARGYPVQVLVALWKYVIIIAVISATRYYRFTQEARVRAAQLERQLASAQLSALQMQLHPHFLFNALNSAAMLALTDPARCYKILIELADLFRLTLSSSTVAEVPLRSELDFLDRYLGIERIRFEDRLLVKFDVGDRTEELLVPSLILQPLVENSIRHGLAQKRDALRLIVRSRVLGDQLVLEVQDDGAGIAATAGGRPAFGVGLTNVEQRLVAANGRPTSIEFDRTGSSSGLIVRLRLPVRRASVASVA
jgi:two-component system, LytTR family, sensor kinase